MGPAPIISIVEPTFGAMRSRPCTAQEAASNREASVQDSSVKGKSFSAGKTQYSASPPSTMSWHRQASARSKDGSTRQVYHGNDSIVCLFICLGDDLQWTPCAAKFSQKSNSPLWQWWQCPHSSALTAVTLSPTLRFRTASPTETIIPDVSWPVTTGILDAKSPLWMCRFDCLCTETLVSNGEPFWGSHVFAVWR